MRHTATDSGFGITSLYRGTLSDAAKRRNRREAGPSTVRRNGRVQEHERGLAQGSEGVTVIEGEGIGGGGGATLASSSLTPSALALTLPPLPLRGEGEERRNDDA